MPMEREKHTSQQTELSRPLEVHVTAIPEQLQERHQWVVWQYQQIDDEIKKPPFNPRTGKAASVGRPETWGSFADAQRAYATKRYAGMGFMLTTGIVGIDIDHCVTNGHYSTEAQAIIERLGTYAELSPSGAGVRLFVLGSLPGPYRRRGNIELYENSRYLTVTGQQINNTPAQLTANQPHLDAVYHALFPPQPPQQQKENTGGGDDRSAIRLLPNEQVLARAYNAKNGQLFRRYYEGDYSLWEGAAARHHSQSEADFTLCLYLLYWTNNDVSQAERLFRHSGLMREKWDRKLKGQETYGERTIAAATQKGRG